jgi:hypothetical protein
MKSELKSVIDKSSNSDVESAKDTTTTTTAGTNKSVSPFISVHKKVVLAQQVLISRVPGLICFFILMAVWPYLQRKASYIFPLMQWFCSLDVILYSYVFVPSNVFPNLDRVTASIKRRLSLSIRSYKVAPVDEAKSVQIEEKAKPVLVTDSDGDSWNVQLK